jgi:hypothetical protein
MRRLLGAVLIVLGAFAAGGIIGTYVPQPARHGTQLSQVPDPAVPVTGATRSWPSVALLAVVLFRCFAAHGRDDCVPLSEHETMAECRALASEYQRTVDFTGLPAAVSYHCVPVK